MSSCCSGRPCAYGEISDYRSGMTAVSAPLLARALPGRTKLGLESPDPRAQEPVRKPALAGYVKRLICALPLTILTRFR